MNIKVPVFAAMKAILYKAAGVRHVFFCSNTKPLIQLSHLLSTFNKVGSKHIFLQLPQCPQKTFCNHFRLMLVVSSVKEQDRCRWQRKGLQRARQVKKGAPASQQEARSTHNLTHAAGRKLTTLHKHKVLGYYGGALQIDESPGGVTAECGPGVLVTEPPSPWGCTALQAVREKPCCHV